MPLKPNELTPAIRRRWPAGQGVRRVGMLSGNRVPGDVRIGRRQVQVRRNLAVLQREHGLDQPGDARRRFQVADVRLHRAEHAAAVRARGRRRARAESACTSIGSPSDVPVPWAST